MALSRRKKLHKIFEDVMRDRGRVYFQPPESARLSYPCSIYKLEAIPKKKADNRNYAGWEKYSMIIVDRDPDSTIAEDMLRAIPTSSFDRRFVADNLYHDVLTIYY